MPDRRSITLTATVMTGGGVLRHLRDLAGGLLDAGRVVRIGGPRRSDPLRALASSLSVPFTPLEEVLDERTIVHLHLADTYDRRILPILVRARRRSSTVVITEHLPRTDASDPSLTSFPRTRGAHQAKTVLKRAQYALSDAVIAVSPSSKRFLVSRYRVPASRIAVVENGLPQKSATAGPAFDRRTGVLCLGSLIRQKGHDLLIEAAGMSSVPWHVTVAGEGPHRSDLQRTADRVAPGRVSFVGWVEDPTTLISSSTVSCLPSRWESFPYAIGEARSLGTPVVASRVDGVPEQIQHGSTGLLVEPDDARELASALDLLVSDRRTWQHLHENGLRSAQSFSLSDMVARTSVVYDRVGGEVGHG